MPATPLRRIRFGVFEADLRTAELFKHGRKVRLRQQPFQVLSMLLEHPGELVRREDLRRQLWPSDTFVNFDTGLNSAVGNLRSVLHDSADAPRYIETLPRRGYRFIAPVETFPVPHPESATVSDPVNEDASRRPSEGAPKQAVRRSPRPRVLWAIAGAACLVVAAFLTFVWPQLSRIAAPPHIRRIAVLPLENLSGDSEQEYFADGLTDALITNLAQINSLTVISRTSVMRYKGTRKALPEIARELHVDAIVEGAVIRAGDRVRVDAQLVEAPTDRHAWAATYERNIGEVTSLQADIARAIANEIRVTLTPEEQARLRRPQSVDPQTYELYMKGRYFWGKRTDDAIRKSIDYFQKAVDKRPDYALAYAALAEAYVTRTDLPPQEIFPKAKAAAYAALRMDDTLAEAHNALAGSLFWYDWDWAGAEKEFERALALNPNYSEAHQWYGLYQRAMGWKNWSAEVKRAGELDPLSLIVAGGAWYYDTGQYDLAIELLSRKAELDPNAAFPQLYLGRTYARKREYVDAIRCLQKCVALSNGEPQCVAYLGYAYALSGNRAEALNALRQLERVSDSRYVSPYDAAVVYGGLGDKDLAFSRLNDALRDHAKEMVSLNVRGELDGLRADARYADLKRRVGLPQ
jgi:TolB-like protein/DNA-binding winged helix-turn-helix (wHTH) protein